MFWNNKKKEPKFVLNLSEYNGLNLDVSEQYTKDLLNGNCDYTVASVDEMIEKLMEDIGSTRMESVAFLFVLFNAINGDK